MHSFLSMFSNTLIIDSILTEQINSYLSKRIHIRGNMKWNYQPSQLKDRLTKTNLAYNNVLG